MRTDDAATKTRDVCNIMLQVAANKCQIICTIKVANDDVIERKVGHEYIFLHVFVLTINKRILYS